MNLVHAAQLLQFSCFLNLMLLLCCQDFTGVPAVVDLACMRDAMKNLGSDSNKINPLVWLFHGDYYVCT